MNIQTDIREYEYEYEYSSHTVVHMWTLDKYTPVYRVDSVRTILSKDCPYYSIHTVSLLFYPHSVLTILSTKFPY